MPIIKIYGFPQKSEELQQLREAIDTKMYQAFGGNYVGTVVTP